MSPQRQSPRAEAPACEERDKLKAILDLAVHEMQWVYEEEGRVAREHPEMLTRFHEVIGYADRRRQEAEEKYLEHIRRHGCAE